jgi:D-alanyl-D-alanine carboxypeptidase
MFTVSAHRLVLPVLAAALLAAAPAAARAVPPDPLHQDLAAIVDGGATSALAVVQHDGRSTGASAGPARRDRPGPVDPYGRFRAGSVTKSFLATVVLQLVDEGRIGLDTPIDHYLAGIPEGDQITVRMLLNHTAGLYNLTNTLPLNPPSGFLTIRWQQWTPAELLARATAQPPVFEPPGKGFSYSDTNYIVLGTLVQRITGHTPAAEIQRRIIAPLHLSNTGIPTTPDIAGPHADGYLPMPDGSVVDITRFNPSVLAYAGDVVSSGADLNRFFQALTGGRLLRPETARLMGTVEAPAQNYGLGLELMSLTCNATALGHDGDVPGYSTWSFTVPETGRSVTVSMSWGTARPKPAVLHLVDDALCGRTD